MSIESKNGDFVRDIHQKSSLPWFRSLDRSDPLWRRFASMQQGSQGGHFRFPMGVPVAICEFWVNLYRACPLQACSSPSRLCKEDTWKLLQRAKIAILFKTQLTKITSPMVSMIRQLQPRVWTACKRPPAVSRVSFSGFPGEF